MDNVVIFESTAKCIKCGSTFEWRCPYYGATYIGNMKEINNRKNCEKIQFNNNIYSAILICPICKKTFIKELD